MKYAFIGFGDLGRQLFNFIRPGDSDEVIFFDDNLDIDNVKMFPLRDYEKPDFLDFSFIVGIGYKHLDFKNAIIKNLASKGRKMHTCVHNTAYVCSSAQIGDGVMIYPLANIDFSVQIESGVVINNSAVVSHDSRIGLCTYISPGVIVSGKVSIGSNCFIGSGSIISSGITIGNNVTIGIGSVVKNCLGDNENVIGNPLKVLERKLRLR